MSDLNTYSSDAPITNPEEDGFKRWPFAQRVAQVIATRKDKSSIVIGINGAWGEGKTSVLNFIQNELNQHSHVVCMKFNPWRFGDEEQLLKGFFFDLANSIDESLSTAAEKVGELLIRFGKPVASLAGQSETIDGLGNMLSSADLEKLRLRIEKILDEQDKRIVILIDDIDRLEKREIHAIFRLVKLTADFKNTAYILAFDHEMVASALQERYGSGQNNAGEAFLEKIIQVPLKLPSVDKISLRKYCFSGVDEALSQAGIDLGQDDSQLFVRNFTYGLESRLNTPRQAKLYSNILMFSLPILKGEVNVVDLMLIEGIRVFYSKLYEVIRRNISLFISESNGRREEEKKGKIKQLISESLDGVNDLDKESAHEILIHLFPRLQGVYGNTHYGSDWEDSWAKSQRICSKTYVARYFSYTVPVDDVSDQLLQEFVEKISQLNIEDVCENITQMINERNAEIVISKLRQLTTSLSYESSKLLSKALVLSAKIFPNPDVLFSFSTPFSRAAMLVGHLVSNIPNKEEQVLLANDLVLSAESLTFAFECLKWFKRNSDDKPDPRGFNLEELKIIGKTLAERISNYEGGPGKLITEFDSNVTPLLYTWSTYGQEGEANNSICSWLEEDPRGATQILLCYVPTAWGMESGLSHKSDFESDQYKSLIQVVDPEMIFNALYKIHGNLLDVDRYPDLTETPLPLRTAQQFSWIHKNAKQLTNDSEDEETVNDE